MKERIKTTSECDDTKFIERVQDAGKIYDNYQLMFNGIKIVKNCYHGEWMSELIEKCNGFHEPQEEKAFFEVLKKIKPESTMIEIGSYWAWYSLWFNSQVENAKNFLIDINHDMLNIGKNNFHLNNLKGNFFLGEVPHFNFYNFLKTNNIDFVDILHCDIQGWEYHLLKECEYHLDKIGYFFISTHTDRFNPGNTWNSPKEMLHEECLTFLKENNFIILCEHNMMESYSHDGLIVAKNPNIDLDFIEIKISKRN
jgi:SAM-dependent methyltransferase